MPAADVDHALVAPAAELGRRLLALAEDQWFDRKSSRIEPRKLAESEIGFANADGGTIAVGLSDGSIEGVDSNPKRLNALMQAAVDFTEPTVITRASLYECVRSDGEADHVLIIEVPPGRVMHATAKDEAFLRIGDENHRLTFAQRRELFYDKSQSTFEAEPTNVAVSGVDPDLIEEYAQYLGASDTSRLLTARGLAIDGNLTIAGLLLFGATPEVILPSALVRVCRFRGTKREFGARQNLISDVRLEGPIPNLLEAAREAIKSQQPTRRALSARGRFDDIALIPEDAWLEGLVNAVVHRSYSTQGDQVHVDIYDDRIVIESPGRFPGLADPAKPLDIVRFARNPRIARVCTDLSITQELGEGIRRMFHEMRKAGLDDPLYHQTSGSVQLTLTAGPGQQALSNRLPRTQQQILGLLRESDMLSTGEITAALAVARPTALRHLAALREAGFVVWSGNSSRDPRASWRLAG